MSVSGIGPTDELFSAVAKDKRRQNLPDSSSLLAASATVDKASLTVPTAAADDPIKEFTDYMKMTPEQRYQAAWLRKHGISEEEFAAMSPEEKRKLMEQMRAEMKEEVQQKAEAKSKSPTDLFA